MDIKDVLDADAMENTFFGTQLVRTPCFSRSANAIDRSFGIEHIGFLGFSEREVECSIRSTRLLVTFERL